MNVLIQQRLIDGPIMYRMTYPFVGCRGDYMQNYSFHVGDRVVRSNSRFGYCAGIVGTIAMVYFCTTDCYDVCIDGFTARHLMFGEDLQLLPSVGTDNAAVRRSPDAGAREARP